MSLEEKEAVVTYLAALTSPAQLATFIAGLADKFSTRSCQRSLAKFHSVLLEVESTC